MHLQEADGERRVELAATGHHLCDEPVGLVGDIAHITSAKRTVDTDRDNIVREATLALHGHMCPLRAYQTGSSSIILFFQENASAFTHFTVSGTIAPIKGDAMTDTTADGYYDEPEVNNGELDLSFLDDDETKN